MAGGCEDCGRLFVREREEETHECARMRDRRIRAEQAYVRDRMRRTGESVVDLRDPEPGR